MNDILFMLLIFIPPVAIYLITMGLYELYLKKKENKNER